MTTREKWILGSTAIISGGLGIFACVESKLPHSNATKDFDSTVVTLFVGGITAVSGAAIAYLCLFMMSACASNKQTQQNFTPDLKEQFIAKEENNDDGFITVTL
ncbi:MAG: hypothetical protein QNK11_04305 [Legionella sp.]|nr:hypothetical protein [Legionella sp.]